MPFLQLPSLSARLARGWACSRFQMGEEYRSGIYRELEVVLVVLIFCELSKVLWPLFG